MKILFAGTPEFAARHLTGLLKAGIPISAVITQPDKPGKRGKKPQPSAVKKVAEAASLTIIQPTKLTAEDIAPFVPDLMIVVAYGQILRPKTLQLPTYGCINVHASLLPRWRGAAPIQRALLAGDTETGVCIMQMDEGLDTGDVLLRETVSISPKDTSQSVTEKLVKTGIPALLKVIDQVTKRTAQPQKQIEDGANYAHKIRKQEAQIDWQSSADSLDKAIRAFQPDPSSFTFLNALRVKIIKAHPIPADDPSNKPGTIIDVSKKGVLVACGEGYLVIERLQLPLGKGSILSAADIVNSRADIIYVGTRFE